MTENLLLTNICHNNWNWFYICRLSMHYLLDISTQYILTYKLAENNKRKLKLEIENFAFFICKIHF